MDEATARPVWAWARSVLSDFIYLLFVGVDLNLLGILPATDACTDGKGLSLIWRGAGRMLARS